MDGLDYAVLYQEQLYIILLCQLIMLQEVLTMSALSVLFMYVDFVCTQVNESYAILPSFHNNAEKRSHKREPIKTKQPLLI